MLEPPRRWVLAVAVVLGAFSPLAIGTVHLWALAVATGLSLAMLSLVLYRRVAVEGKPLLIGWAGGALLFLTLATAFQLVPLSPAVIEELSPKAHEILSFTLGPFALYAEDAWRPLSLAPPETARELLRLVGLAAAFLAARNGLTERGDLRRLLASLALVGVALVGIGAIHQVSGARAILGLYRSPGAMSQFFNSTFVNPNHLAAFLVLATLAALALSVSEDVTIGWRRAMAVAAVVCALGVLLSLSRAGILSLAGGGVLLAALLARSRSPGSRRRGARVLLWVLLLLGIAAGTALALFSERILEELSTSALHNDLRGASLKLQLWKDSLPLLSDFWLVGIGKGAFPGVYPLYQSHLGQYTFTHVENHYLQTLVDHGVLVGGGFLAIIGAVLLHQILTRRSAIASGALAGLAAVCVHNAADFSLDTGGVAFPFILVFGALLGRPRISPAPARANAGRWRTVIAGAWLLASIAAIVLIVPYARSQKASRAIARINAAKVDADQVRTVLREEIPEHPADYLVFLAGAARLSTSPTVDIRTAMRLVNRALYLNPASADVHLIAARVLRIMGRLDQAEIEYRLAAQRNPQALETAFSALQRLPRGLPHLLHVARTFSQRLALAAFLERHRRRGDAVGLLRRLLRERPSAPDALLLLTRMELAAGHAASVLSLARRLVATPEHAFEATLAAARASALLGAPRLALRLYRLAREARPVHPESYLRSAVLHLQLREGRAARRVLSALLRVNLLAASRPRFSLLLGQAWELEGHPERALREYRRVRPGDSLYPQAAARVRALRGTRSP